MRERCRRERQRLFRQTITPPLPQKRECIADAHQSAHVSPETGLYGGAICCRIMEMRHPVKNDDIFLAC
ncbi:MAG: hypothetical protein KatS3mg058_1452 [Roseiflexus sp.]|uniref:Uncharacterized protein n=1 Tax=Roseiflexus castenholzii (strain DSM 13941 / HLO8) TaxID=383372 RepID=A7NIA7_ROSCS|nr:hypothetical protein Rcas_1108 [Roseiflexus castenholzii DSM 13941]GIW00049.1 MAG: hypothetical protein KatS3mg058_1452 [Roseiflexus sp.]